MIPTLVIDETHVTQVLDKIGPDVRQALTESLGQIAKSTEADARARAQAHIRFLGVKKPGTYAPSIKGGVADKGGSRITGYVRSAHPLAHLLELGFNITDLMIVPGTGKNTSAQAGDIMKFAGDAGDVFRAVVHRHATTVPPYPAIYPAFEAARPDIMDAFDKAAKGAGQ
jgi:hypothetical protein